MYGLENDQFIGMTVEEVLNYLEVRHIEVACHDMETEDDYEEIDIGSDCCYADHYEILFEDGVCFGSMLIEWD